MGAEPGVASSPPAIGLLERAFLLPTLRITSPRA